MLARKKESILPFGTGTRFSVDTALGLVCGEGEGEREGKLFAIRWLGRR